MYEFNEDEKQHAIKVINRLKADALNNNISANELVTQLNTARKRYIIGFTAGSILSASGIVLIAFGVHNRQIYLNNKQSVALGIADENLGFKIRF